MRYTKQTWKTGRLGGTPISAARLQHIEDGLEAVDLAVDEAVPDPRLGGVYLATADEDIALLNPPLPPNTLVVRKPAE